MRRLQGLLLLLALLTGSVLLGQEQKKEGELTKEERAKLEAEAERLNGEGYKYYLAAKFAEAEKEWRRALQLRQRLYPPSQFPDGHPALATSLNNLAFLLQAQGRLAQAEPLYRDALAMRQKLYPPAQYPEGHAELATSLNNLGGLLKAQGRFASAEPFYRDALAMRRKLYPPTRYPDGHVEVATSLNNMGSLLQDLGQLTQAEPFYRDALAMRQKLYPAGRYPVGHSDLVHSFQNMTALLLAQGQVASAEPHARDAWTMCQRLYPPTRYPDGHQDLAQSLHNVAAVLMRLGQLTQAERFYRDALAMRQKLYPPGRYPNGHPHLATSLNNLAAALKDQGQLAHAEQFFRDALTMRQKLYPRTRYPDGHPDIAQCLNNLAFVLQAQGRKTHAERLYRDAWAMHQKIYPPSRYPEGHPSVATTLDNVGLILHEQNLFTDAESFYRDALAMRQKLYPAARYPKGHPVLAKSLNNLGLALHDQGRHADAEPFCRDALVMRQQLYPLARFPDGHPDLARSLNSLASVIHNQGRLTQAEPLYRAALEMRQKLYPSSSYPDGHPELAASLHNLASLLYDQTQYSRAEPYLRDALAMYRRLAKLHAEVRGDGEALTYLATQPGPFHAYLSLAQQQPHLAPQAYATLWASRNVLMRLAAQKHVAVRAAAVSLHFRQRWEELVGRKRQRTQMLLATASHDPATVQARERQLEEGDRQINALEIQVREGLSAQQELQRQDSSSPVELQHFLPKEAVFVDLMRYVLGEQNPAKPGKEGKRRSLRYVAFLVTKEQVRQIDLGPAEPLEIAVRHWREQITQTNTVSEAPTTLRRLLWEPLEKNFPPGTTTVYLCPDQQLCFLPWGALPGKKADTVLLEDYTLAIVPHGPYLLGQLLGTKDKAAKSADLLVMGGVKYDDAPAQALPAMDRGGDDPKAAPVNAHKGGWPYLPGTAQEAAAIRKLAEQQKLKSLYLSEKDASIDRFRQELPKARIAHLATHGFFADAKFRSVLQMDPKLFVMRGQERVGAGALLPSLLSGLVFAGANRPETPGRGIVTAEELFDLDLTSMELAVLSACETGLGEVGGGEGVFGLQRAFHVAGCQNVIASLWKVNDVATMVLMEEFYRNLWEKELSKREALRQAQLTVYRNPDLVLKRAEQMGIRGIEDEAAPLPKDKPATARRSPPAWWAAFVLSGLGE